LKVLFDSNIYVSRILHGGLPAQVLKVATQAGLTLYVSETILEEVRDVLGRHGIRASLVGALVREIGRSARTVKIHRQKFWEVSLTKEDNYILEAAVAANADYLVRGVSEPGRGRADATQDCGRTDGGIPFRHHALQAA
jgi:putative PIN family toxin of toxin-antitoxin system